MDPGFDERRTTNLGRMVEQWGLVPLPISRNSLTRISLTATWARKISPCIRSCRRAALSRWMNRETGCSKAPGGPSTSVPFICGNPRWAYLLLVQHAAGRDHSAAASFVSGRRCESASSAGSRSARASGGRRYEVDRVACRSILLQIESASSTELRCWRRENFRVRPEVNPRSLPAIVRRTPGSKPPARQEPAGLPPARARSRSTPFRISA